MQVKDNVGHLGANLQIHVGIHTSTQLVHEHLHLLWNNILYKAEQLPQKIWCPHVWWESWVFQEVGWGGKEVSHSHSAFTACATNSWGELRVPSRRRDLNLSLWWLSPVYYLFISWVLTQAVSALGLYGWWKCLGTSSMSQCCCSTSPLASHMSRLCPLFCLQQTWLCFYAILWYPKCQIAFNEDRSETRQPTSTLHLALGIH